MNPEPGKHKLFERMIKFEKNSNCKKPFSPSLNTVVGDYIYITKTTFNFNLNKAVTQHGYT